ncbi:MAG: hypothetical protein AAGC60_29455 [Acidobacteriota bacterium]
MMVRRLTAFALALALSSFCLVPAPVATAQEFTPNTSCVLDDGTVLYGLTPEECATHNGDFFNGHYVPGG